MATSKHEVGELIGRYTENLQRYKLMDNRLAQARVALRSKLPDAERDLEAVRMLSAFKDSTEPVNTRYELADGLFAYAMIQKPKTVILAIGASILVEYSFEEATKIFETTLTNLRNRLKEFDEDLDFVSEQITTTQVLMSRFYNYDVKQRKLKKEKQPPQ